MAHVFITGGSSGLGRYLAIELGRRGNDISLIARRSTELEETAEAVRQTGAKAAWRVADVTDANGVSVAAQELANELGPIDIAIANAGAGWPTPAGRTPSGKVTEMMKLNFDGVVHTFYAVLPDMLDRRSGQLVAVSSIAAFFGIPGSSAYSATKAAVTVWCEGLSAELRDQGVAVTCIHPGFVKTPLTEKNKFPMPFLMEPEQAANIMADGILGRRRRVDYPFAMATPAKLVRFLPGPIFEALVGRMAPRAADTKSER